MPQTIIVLDFGSQYTQVIARRIREANVYSQVIPYNSSLTEIKKLKPLGIVLSGGQPAFLPEVHQSQIREFLIWAFLFLEFVTAYN